MYCAALFISSVEQWNCHEWLRMNGLGTVPRQVGCGDKERGAQRILEHERETKAGRERVSQNPTERRRWLCLSGLNSLLSSSIQNVGCHGWWEIS